MHLNPPTLVTLVLTMIGCIFAAPVLIKGFGRRGKGVKYEKNFLIQRAPQVVSLLNIAVIIASFCAYTGVLPPQSGTTPLLAAGAIYPDGWVSIVSWLGVFIYLIGLIFMIGGWYSLGEAFSTDAEILDGQTVRNTGLLAFVMHPAYSGIIQSLLGASLAATSLTGVLFTLFLVAPLWLNRAKYEEKLLLESLGSSYKEYAERMRWRRLVPVFIPIGV